MANAASSPCTPARIDRLTHLWNVKGLSSVEIAREMHLTKNQIIGKAHRLGLDQRSSPIKGVTGTGKNYTREKLRRERKAARAKALQTTTAPKDRLSALGHIRALPPLSRNPGSQCQFIEGEARNREFCGARTVEGTSWCPDHHAIVFRPVKPEWAGDPLASRSQPEANPAQSFPQVAAPV